MRVVLSGGGTAGHINPALAVAELLRERDCEVLYAGKPTGVEARLVEQANIRFQGFQAEGFDRSRPLSLPHAVFTLLSSSRAAKRWFAEVNPDVVACFGGYVCIPVGRAALQTHTPLVVHEQNSVMGMANAYLAKHADAVCLTYEQAGKALQASGQAAKLRLTGNPVRKSVFEATRDESRAALGIPDEAVLLLITGGSLGARHLNQAIVALKELLLAVPQLYIIHLTGPAECEATTQALDLSASEQTRWQVLGYTDKMGQCMAAADAVLSRAGASSLAEISARALPALLVPFPYATADHQTLNAQACVHAGAAFMVPDDQLESSDFREKLLSLVSDAALRERMAKAARAQKTQDAACLVADAIMDAAAAHTQARVQ